MTAGPHDNKAKTKAKNIKQQSSTWRSPIETALSPVYLLKNYECIYHQIDFLLRKYNYVIKVAFSC